MIRDISYLAPGACSLMFWSILVDVLNDACVYDAGQLEKAGVVGCSLRTHGRGLPFADGLSSFFPYYWS